MLFDFKRFCLLILTFGLFFGNAQSQSFGTPLFTENFGSVPVNITTQPAINQYRNSISGRGAVGNDFWFWPYTCSGQGYLTLSTPALRTSTSLALSPDSAGVTGWSFVQSSVFSGTPYNGTNLNNPANTWCLSGTSWNGPNPSNCNGTLMRWYQVCGIWRLGYWKKYDLNYLVNCSSWHAGMDDGGYCLSADPFYAHGADSAWHRGPDHTGNTNGMMLVVNAALEPGMFYKRNITGLCYGAQLDFRSFYENILTPSSCGGNGLPINIRYEVWSADPGNDESNSTIAVGGQSCNGAILLADTSTGNVGTSAAVTWHQTDLLFTVPQSQDSAVIILRNNTGGGCGNDLAIDDISVSPYTPFTIGYNAVTTNYCQTGHITLQASVTSGNIPQSIPYVFQWQVANQASPNNWTNLGSPINNISNASLVLNVASINNKLYRIISAASIQNLNNSNCYVASAAFDGNSVVIPTGSITTSLSGVCGTPQHSPQTASFSVNYQGNIFPWTYYYQINSGPVLSQVVNSPNTNDTQTITITDSTVVTLIQISTSSCTVPVTSQAVIPYSISSPAAPVLITGPNPACIGSTASFTVANIPGATGYNWVASTGGWQVITGQGTNSVQLLIGSTPISVSITTQNACGTNTFNSAPFQTTNNPPASPAGIIATNGLCSLADSLGTTNILFHAATVLGTQNYIWSFNSPVVIGNQTSGTGQYLQDIILSIPNNLGSFTLGIQSENYCGFSGLTLHTFTLDHQPKTTLIAGDVSCYGGNNGNVSLTVNGGTAPYSYNWSNSSTGQNLNGIISGTYIATITDANGCSTTAGGTVNQPASALNANVTVVNVLVTGQSNGSAAVSVTGGTSPYGYAWNTIPAQATDSAVNLAAGIYVITVNDLNGCSVTATGIVTEPGSVLTASVSGIYNVSCYGLSNGYATVTAAGGTAPYLYSWSTNPVQITPLVSNLAAGNYSVTVTDFNGATTSASVSISQPLALSMGACSHIDALCAGTYGSVSAGVITNAQGNVNYIWENSSNQVVGNRAIVNLLPAGIYALTVSDNCNSLTCSQTIAQPAAFSMSACSHVDALCNGGTGSVTAGTISNAQGSVGYIWKNSSDVIVGNTATVSGITAGTYTLVVSDNCNSLTCTQTISEPQSMVMAACSHVDVNCTVLGSVTAGTVSNSHGNLVYTWRNSNNVILGTTPTVSSLVAGNYTLAVSDNCTVLTCSQTILQSTSMTMAACTHTDLQCNSSCGGNNTGSVTAGVITGAQGSVHYSWKNSSGSVVGTTAAVTGLPAGAYALTVSDNCGSLSCSQTIGQPTALAVGSCSHTDLSCNSSCGGNNTGSVTAGSISGNQGAVHYIWKNASGVIVGTNASVSGLPAGIYTLTVSDNCSSVNCSQTIGQPSALLISTCSHTNVTCRGESDGSVSAGIISNAQGTPHYSWKNSFGTVVGSTAIVNNLPAGTYTLTVSDNCGSITASQVVSQPIAMTMASCSHTNATLNNQGSVTAGAISNAQGNVVYTWKNAANQLVGHTVAITGLPAGIYSLTVQDNCTTLTCSETISTATGIDNFGGESNFEIQLFPNPFSDQYHIKVSGYDNLPVQIEIFDLLGQRLSISTIANDTESIFSGKQLSSGSYFIRCSQGNNYKTIKIIKSE